MTVWVMGTHDGWQHHTVGMVESDSKPVMAEGTDLWVLALDDGQLAYCRDNDLTPIQYMNDLAFDGTLSMETGKHEPYMDGTAREGHGFDDAEEPRTMTVGRLRAELRHLAPNTLVNVTVSTEDEDVFSGWNPVVQAGEPDQPTVTLHCLEADNAVVTPSIIPDHS